MVEIRTHELCEDRPDLLEAYAAVHAANDREVNPGDPPAPVAELAGELFDHPPQQRHLGWIATVDGEPAGELVVNLEEVEENRHLVDVECLAVVPSHRRLGVADALLRACTEVDAVTSRASITFWVPVVPDGAGPAYAARCGTSMRLEERCSRLAMGDLPDVVVDGWVAEGRARTDGYRVVRWAGPVPEQHLDHLVAVRRAMADAPVDDLDWTAPAMDRDEVRAFDDAAIRRGLRPVITLAVSPDGRPAGFSALFLNAHRPELAWQGDTGVLDEHRGRGLGRWLKAENLRFAQATDDRIATIETFNAESNPWMLDINVTMGFRPHVGYQAWQGEIADLRAVLAG